MTVDTSLFVDPMFPQPPLDNSPIGEWARSFVNSLREHQFGVVDGTRQQITQLESDYIAADAALESGITIELGTLTTDVAAVASRVTTLESQVQTPTTGLLARVTTTESTIATHDTAIATLNTTVGTHGTSITQLITDVDTVEARVTTTEADIVTNATAISTLDGSVATLSTTVSSHTSSITTINSTLTTRARVWLQTSAPSSGHQTGDLWLDSDDGYKVYRYSGTAWDAVPDARIATNEANIATNTSAITSLNGSVATLNTTVSAHTTSISTAEAYITDIAQSLAPSTFEQDGLFFTSDAGTLWPAIFSGGTFTDVANIGRVAQTTGITHIIQRGLITLIAGKTYRITTKARILTDATNGFAPVPLVGVWIWSATAYLGAGYWISTFVTKAVADGWFTITGTFTLADLLIATPTAVKVRAGIVPCWNGSGTSDAVAQTVQVLFEDVTDITATNAVVVTNTADISTNTSAITSLNSSVASHGTTISSHTSSISSLGTDVSTLQGQMTTANANISSLGTTTTGLTSSLATLTTTVTANYSITTAIGVINSSPNFSDNANSTGVPTNWADWADGSACTRVTGLAPQPYAVNIRGVAGYNGGLRQSVLGRLSTGWHVLEADVTLVSGTFAGAGIHLNWDGGGADLVFSTDLDTSGTAPGAGTTGRLYKFRKLVQATAGTIYNNIYAMSHYSGLGSNAADNLITWHRCAVRPASQAEIEARTATNDLVTANATISSHTSSIASNASAISTLTTNVAARFTADQKNSQNMLRDSTFRTADYWTYSSGLYYNQAYTDHIYAYWPYGVNRSAYQDVRVQEGARYALSGDIYSDNDNEIRLYIHWLNEAKSAGVGANSGYDGVTSWPGHPGWRKYTFDINNANVNGGYGAVAPTGAAWARIYVDNWPYDGTVGGSAARRIKFERGDYCTAWSEDDGYVEALGVAADLATTDATVSSHTSSIATNTSAISALTSTVTANYASLGQRMTGAINSSADFADNANATGVPTNWTDWVNAAADGTRVTGLAPQPYAYRQAGRAGSAGGVIQILSGRVSQGWHVIEADVTLVSGSFSGAGVYFEWGPSAAVYTVVCTFATDLDTSGVAPGSGTTGQLYKFRKLVNINSACGFSALYAMSHWGGHGNISSANSITWHRCAIRPASQAEIEARQATTDLVTTNANVSANTTAIATEASARASADTILTAQVSGAASNQAINTSPTFADNANATGLPTNWSDWANGSGTRVTGIAPQPYAWTLAGGAAANAGVQQGITAGISTGWHVLEADVTLNSGALTGAGVLVNGDPGGAYSEWPLIFSTDPDTSGSVVGAGTTGRLYKFRKLVQVTRGDTFNIIYAMGHYSSLGSTSGANSITWHRCAIRAASQAEIEARQAKTDLVTTNASVATNASAIATVDGKLSASYALTVDGNGRIASMKLLSTGATSSVVFKADTFAVYNGSSDVAMFEVSGGAVYIAGSKVRTDSLTANAVTYAESDSNDADTALTKDTWTTVIEKAITTTGKRVLILVNAAPYVTTSGATFPIMEVRILRDSTVIRGPVTTHYYQYDGSSGMIAGGNVAMSEIDEPTAGTYTYKLQCRPSHATGAALESAGCTNRSIFLTEFKR